MSAINRIDEDLMENNAKDPFFVWFIKRSDGLERRYQWLVNERPSDISEDDNYSEFKRFDVIRAFERDTETVYQGTEDQELLIWTFCEEIERKNR